MRSLDSSFRLPHLPSRQPRLIALLLVVGLSGCGDVDRRFGSSATYQPPASHRIVVETVVDLPFDQAWDELIRRLSESSFRVSTLEKASRFLSIETKRTSDSATSKNRPEHFVDCGRTTRNFSEGDEKETFSYDVAQSSRHRESDVVSGGYRVSLVDRRVELIARTTLYLQPEGERRTRVTVKSRYELKIEVSGTARVMPTDSGDAPGSPQAFGPRVESIQFSTFRPGEDARSGGLTCRATGDLEHALIALANPAAAI